jgi:hypothetical protein
MALFRWVIAGRGRIPFHDQPGGKAQVQGELATESSNGIPENHITSKAEYTNTQQALPDLWVYLAHN